MKIIELSCLLMMSHCILGGSSGPIKARYLPERVPRQFGYVQSVMRHPKEAANIVTHYKKTAIYQWQPLVTAAETIGIGVHVPTNVN
jgi:hypothetical protein